MDRRTLEKRYDQVTQEVQFLRYRCRDLEQEARVIGPELHRAYQKIDRVEEQRDKLMAENKVLKQKVKDLTLWSASTRGENKDESRAVVVKPSVKRRGRKRPGRKKGHPAALRPMPDQIDVHQKVPLPKDSGGCDSCPCCSTRLMELEDHQRVVEDIIPEKVVIKCFIHEAYTGECPACREG